MAMDNWLITSHDGSIHYFAGFPEAYKQWLKDGKLFSVKRPVRTAGLKHRWIRLDREEIERINASLAKH